jgi:hypothetical protein
LFSLLAPVTLLAFYITNIGHLPFSASGKLCPAYILNNSRPEKTRLPSYVDAGTTKRTAKIIRKFIPNCCADFKS